MIAAAIPRAACSNKLPILCPIPPEIASRTHISITTGVRRPLLLANLNSMALDFIARQKVHGTTLNLFIVEDCPLSPSYHFRKDRPHDRRNTDPRSCAAVDLHRARHGWFRHRSRPYRPTVRMGRGRTSASAQRTLTRCSFCFTASTTTPRATSSQPFPSCAKRRGPVTRGTSVHVTSYSVIWLPLRPATPRYV